MGAAWDFKPLEREVFVNDNLTFACFDEKLNTWMGGCRGSGVLIKNDDHWKIKHYQLSVNAPNDIVQDFIQLVDKYNEKLKIN
ncbi:MAG: nuclear transport factor 2 family protein [Bacteroidetes bacterium]|nr:nuclear transport factor 2 family protein [Bacteroidota bacterium]